MGGEMSALPDKETMEADWAKWVERNRALMNADEEIDFQTDYVLDIAKDCGSDFPWNLDVADMFKEWHHHKDEDILTYRDKSFASKFRHAVPNPPHQLHVRPRRLPRHLHAPDKEVNKPTSVWKKGDNWKQLNSKKKISNLRRNPQHIQCFNKHYIFNNVMQFGIQY